MKYQEINLEVNAPISFVFNYISLHENFRKINVASSLYKCEFMDEELIEGSGFVKAGAVYNLKITIKNLIIYVGCLTLAIEKDKLIKYRYIYNDIVDPKEETPLEEGMKSTILNFLNATPLEGSWILKDLGNSKTEMKVLIEVNGKMGFFRKIYYWFSTRLPSKDKKESLRIFQEIKQQIELDYQSS